MADVIRRVVTQMGLESSDYQRAADGVAQANEKMVVSGQKVVDTTAQIEQRQITSSRTIDKLEASVDKAVRAQQLYERQLAIVQRAVEDGNISQERAATVSAKVTANYQRTITGLAALDGATTKAGGTTRNMGAIAQQAGYQIGDFAVQVASGQGVLRPFIQQGTQLISMFGPWGAVIGAAGAVLGALYTSLVDTDKGAESATKSMDALQKATGALADQTSREIELSRKATEERLRSAEATQAAAREELRLAQAILDQAAAAEIRDRASGASADRAGAYYRTRAANEAAGIAQLQEKINEAGAAYDDASNSVSKLRERLTGLGSSYDKQIADNDNLIDALGRSRHEYEVTAKTQEILRGNFAGTGDQARALAERLVTQNEVISKLTGSYDKASKALESERKQAEKSIASMELQAKMQGLIADAYGESAAAGHEAELKMKAALATVGLGKTAYEAYYAALKKVEAGERAEASAKDLNNEKLKTANDLEALRIAQILDPQVKHEEELAAERQQHRNELMEKYNGQLGEVNKHMAEFDKQKAIEDQTRYWNDVTSLAKTYSDDITSYLVDGLTGVGNSGKSMWEDMWDAALAGAKRLLVKLAATFLENTLILPIVTQIVGSNSSLLGIVSAGGSAASSLGSLSGGGSLLGSIGNLFSASTWLNGSTGVGDLFASAGNWLGGADLGATFGNAGLNLSSLGGMAGGLLGNLGANALFGDRGIGANIGGTIGAIAGSFIPIPVVGTLIGSFLGNALGGLFGNSQPSDMFANTGIDLTKGTIGSVEHGRADETSDTNNSASQNLASSFLAIEKQLLALTGGTGPNSAFTKVGSRDGIVVGVGDGATFWNNLGSRKTFANTEEGAQQAIDWMVQQLAKQVTGVTNADIQKVLDKGGTAEEIISNLTLVQNILQSTAVAADPLVTALQSINDSFDALKKQATDLGLSTDLLSKLEAARQKQLDEASAGYSLGGYANVASSLSTITNFLSGQQLSDVSSLSPLGKQSLAQQQFNDLLAKVQGGDLTQTSNLTGAASNYLSIARTNYGSTAGFSSVESYVTQSLAALGESISSQQSIADQITKAMQLATQSQVEAITAVKDEISRMRLDLKMLQQALAA
ncbi:hypothetical protein [Parvibaculum sp.]|uniref:hypothetical protein n=1 Tax=Parvibaculum sp. TaxID=2024848 RepID=UPI00320EE7D3